MINEQTMQWSEMVEKQRKEEWELKRAHAESSKEDLKKIIDVVQVAQEKQLQMKQDKYVNFL